MLDDKGRTQPMRIIKGCVAGDQQATHSYIGFMFRLDFKEAVRLPKLIEQGGEKGEPRRGSGVDDVDDDGVAEDSRDGDGTKSRMPRFGWKGHARV